MRHAQIKHAVKIALVTVMSAWLAFASMPAVAMPTVAAADAAQIQSLTQAQTAPKNLVKAGVVCGLLIGCYNTYPHYYYRRPIYYHHYYRPRYYHVRRCHVHVYYRHGYRHVVRRCY